MDDLPNEILLNIFHQLDRRELKVILNVCKRWRELIITSSDLMRQLPLTLVKEWLPKIEFMGNFGEFVKEVNFEYCSFETLDEFKNILNLLPCVEVLRINYIYIKQPTTTPTLIPGNNNTIAQEVEIPEFPFLRRLELSSKFWGYITQVDGKILKHLNTNRLQFLKIHLPMQKFSSDFIEFLCKQTNLKTLQVYDDFIDSFVFDDFVDFVSYQEYISSLFEIDLSQRAEFQLKSFSINYRGDHRENFERFLNSQSDLEELEFCKYDDDFVKFKINFDLIKNLNVRKLNLYIDFLPSNNLTNVENFVNPSIHDLTLMGYNNDPAMFNYLLRIFPNVRTLHLEYMNEFNCDSLVELKHLEELTVDHFKVDCMLNVRIEKLKSLEIKHLYPFVVTDFENIVENNPKIEQLIVRDISHFNTMCSIRNAMQILVKGLKFLQQLTVIQNQDSHDCIKLLVDNRKRLLQMTPITMTLCRDVVEHLKNFYSYQIIKIL